MAKPSSPKSHAAGVGYILRVFPLLNIAGFALCAYFWFNEWLRSKRRVFAASSALLVASSLSSLRAITVAPNVIAIDLNVENPVELKVSLLNLIATAKETLSEYTGLINAVSLALVAASILIEWFCLMNLAKTSPHLFMGRISSITVKTYPLIPVILVLTLPASIISYNELAALEPRIHALEEPTLETARTWIRAFYRAVLPINSASFILVALQTVTYVVLAHAFIRRTHQWRPSEATPPQSAASRSSIG